MFQLTIGNYSYTANVNHDYYFSSTNYPPVHPIMDDRVKSYDRLLHQSLDKSFREHCLGNGNQIEELLRGAQLKSIIKPTLEQEPIISRQLSKREFDKLSLLWIAVFADYSDSAELLVRSGADVNELFGHHDPQVIDEKSTILHQLLKMEPFPENERLIRLVTDHGADLQARDYNGETALHIAVRKSRVQLVEMLLEKGADVNAAANEGITPVLFAASNVNANELVPLLMKHGADVGAKDSQGRNAWYYLSYSWVEYIELPRVLIEKGVSLKENTNYHELIHLAAMIGKNELVKLFLDYGVDVNTQNELSTFPLYDAAQSGRNTVVETLLKRGANIDLKTIDGRTALHAVCEHAMTASMLLREHKFESTIKLLLSAGADVLVEDHRGQTPFSLMSSSNNVKEEKTYWLMIKVLALRKVLHPSIELKDERIIERFSKFRNYYRECLEEIDRMKLTGFIETCTFFELFTKSQCQIAALMRNPEFESKFRLYDLNRFSIYAEFLLPAFERAQKHYHAMLDQQNLINEAFYNMLPYLIVKKVVRYIFNDCCSENVMKFNKIFE